MDPRAATLDLGVLGMPGATAYFGMLAQGDPQPGETVVVSGAAGACGTLAGQLAKQRGARVVGICGPSRKCAYLVDTLGFDAAVSYRAADFEAQLRAACGGRGIDVYYDNVGGAVSEACLRLANRGARIPVCGQISRYEEDVAYTTLLSPAALAPDISAHLARQGAKRERFLVLDYQHQWGDGVADVHSRILDGEVQVPETTWHGFVPGVAFCEMMGGANIGKALVNVQAAAPPRRSQRTVRADTSLGFQHVHTALC